MGSIQTEALQFAYDGVLAIIDSTPDNDTLPGTLNDEVFTGGAGNDTLIGGGGNDVARFLGNHDEYQLSTDEIGRITVRDVNTANGDEGTDTLDGAMALRFADGDYAANVVSRGGEFRVNTTTEDFRTTPSIMALADGGFVVSWTNWTEGGLNPDIYAQLYNSDGTRQGSEFRVNATANNEQVAQNIVALNDGGFVISWEGDPGDTIFAQRYSSNGAMQGGELLLGSNTEGFQSDHTITALADGELVVSWTSTKIVGSTFTYNIYAQLYSMDGTALGEEFQINTTIGGYKHLLRLRR